MTQRSAQVWSEHDYMSGPQENLRVLQSYEAEYARRVAFAEEGFRDPKVLAGHQAASRSWLAMKRRSGLTKPSVKVL